MTAFVQGLIGESSAIAYIGDPLSLSTSSDKSQIPESMLVVDSGGVLPVPVPAMVWLFGTALIGLVGFSKRKKAAYL